jgi:hypothetical protein
MARLWITPGRGCLFSYLFEGVLECWSSGVLKKQRTTNLTIDFDVARNFYPWQF